MPVIKSAIKKLRQDVKKRKTNDVLRRKVEQAIHAAKKENTKKMISSAFSLIDKAAKKHLIHVNKAARMKSSLSKNGSVTKKSETPRVIKKTPVKTATQKGKTTKTRAKTKKA